jgi:hypothetical protein
VWNCRAIRTRRVKRFGHEAKHAVFAVLDENGDDAYYIVTGPGGYMRDRNRRQ